MAEIKNSSADANRSRSFGSRFKAAGLFLWGGAVLLQAAAWFEAQGLIPTFLAFAGGLLGISLFLRRRLLRVYPISGAMVLGFTSYYFLIPPVATLLEGKPLTYNLENPTLVFFHAFICMLALMLAHFSYQNVRLLQRLRWTIAKKVYRPIGLFRTPSPVQLYTMGCIGLGATAFRLVAAAGVEGEVPSPFLQLLNGLYPLSLLPYVLLIQHLTITGKTKMPQKWIGIIIYTLLVIAVSLGKNSRAAFLEGLASLGLMYAYGVYVGVIQISSTVRRLAIGLLAFVLFIGPIGDLATSMVIVRGERSNLSPIELAFRTMSVFADKDAIRTRRETDLARHSIWDERYVDNIFLNRLANLKFADNSIGLVGRMSQGSRAYLIYIEWQRVLSVLPRPLLSVLGLSVDKGFVISGSGGDFVLYVVSGNRQVVGGYRTGSLFGSGFALFGWWYPLVMVLAAMLLFALVDALTFRTGSDRSSNIRDGWRPVFSPLAIISFFSWVVYFTSAPKGVESMSGLAVYPLRGWIQGLALYSVAFWLSFYLRRPLQLRRR